MDDFNEKLQETDVWQLYEKNKRYLQSKSFYSDFDKAYRFYEGKQWDDKAPKDMPLPVLNVIQPIVDYKVSTVSQYGLSPVLSNSDYFDEQFAIAADGICEHLNDYFRRVWEFNEMDVTVWDSNHQAAIAGSVGLYCYWDDTEKKVKQELKNSIDVLFGDEQQTDIQKQPYILMPYRRPVADIREEAKTYGCKKEDIESIVADTEYQEQAGDYAKTEVDTDSKCLAIVKLFRKNGTIWVEKSTRTCVFCEATDTGLTRYPIAWLTWGSLMGSCRGNGTVLQWIPNQVEINKNYARRAVAIMQCAYPRMAYREDLVNAESLMTVGAAISVKGGAIQNIDEAIKYLNPASSSADASNFCNEIIKATRDLAGASDSVTGNVKPEQASGRAILAVQEASAAPLSRQVSRMKKYVEDIVRIWWEISTKYQADGAPVFYSTGKPADGEKEQFAYEVIPPAFVEKLKFNIRIDVSPTSAYSLYSVEQTLENLFMNQLITFEEFVKLLPNASIMPKDKLQQVILDRATQEQKLQAAYTQGATEQKEADKADIQRLAQMGQQYIQAQAQAQAQPKETTA